MGSHSTQAEVEKPAGVDDEEVLLALAYEAQKTPRAFGPHSVMEALLAFERGYIWEAATALLEEEPDDDDEELEDPEPEDEASESSDDEPEAS